MKGRRGEEVWVLDVVVRELKETGDGERFEAHVPVINAQIFSRIVGKKTFPCRL